MTDLVSTVPGVFTAFQGLITTAASGVTVNNQGVSVFAFALTQDEPANYVILSEISNHAWKPEGIGYQFREDYNINGYATVWTGASPADDVSVTGAVLQDTYNLFNTCVQSVMVDNANMPIFNSSPTPFQGLPVFARYSAAPGKVNSGAQGWAGVVQFSYHFSALVYPH